MEGAPVATTITMDVGNPEAGCSHDSENVRQNVQGQGESDGRSHRWNHNLQMFCSADDRLTVQLCSHIFALGVSAPSSRNHVVQVGLLLVSRLAARPLNDLGRACQSHSSMNFISFAKHSLLVQGLVLGSGVGRCTGGGVCIARQVQRKDPAGESAGPAAARTAGTARCWRGPAARDGTHRENSHTS